MAYYYLIVALSRRQTLRILFFYILIVFATLIFLDKDLADQRAFFYICVIDMEKE